MGKPPRPSSEQVSALQAYAELSAVEADVTVRAEGGRVRRELSLEPGAVYLLTVEPAK